jgi:hypothetical protein
MIRINGGIIDPLLDPSREGRGIDEATPLGEGQAPYRAVEEAIKGALIV